MSKEPVKIKTSDRKAMMLFWQEAMRRHAEQSKAGKSFLDLDDPFLGEIRDLPERFGKN